MHRTGMLLLYMLVMIHTLLLIFRSMIMSSMTAMHKHMHKEATKQKRKWQKRCQVLSMIEN